MTHDVRWELRHKNHEKGYDTWAETPPEHACAYDMRRGNLRASVNGSKPRTPHEWLEQLEEEAREWVITASGWEPIDQALAALSSLLKP